MFCSLYLYNGLFDFPKLITKMNEILHSNANITLTQLPISYYCKDTTLGDFLHKNFLRKDHHCHHLKGSKSLHNLRLHHQLELPHQRASLPLQHAHSCPDLSGIHPMHPKLHGIVLMTSVSVFDNETVPNGLQKCKNFMLNYWTKKFPFVSDDLYFSIFGPYIFRNLSFSEIPIATPWKLLSDVRLL